VIFVLVLTTIFSNAKYMLASNFCISVAISICYCNNLSSFVTEYEAMAVSRCHVDIVIRSVNGI